MTAEELIIGHFNNTLTASQQESLQGLLSSSPDVRSLYEQHKSLQSAMESDSDTIVPAMWLEQTVLQTALGVASATGTIGVTAGFWGAAKIIAVVATVVVSGGSATYFLSKSESPSAPPPEASAPAKVTQTAVARGVQAAPAPPAPADAKPAAAAASATAAPAQRGSSVPMVTRVQPRTPSVSLAKPAEPGIQLGGTDVVIRKNPKTGDPSGNK